MIDLMHPSLETTIEAPDGVIEIPRIMALCPFAIVDLPAGPRRWEPVDVWADTEDDVFHEVRVTYQTQGERSITTVAAPQHSDVNELALRVAMPLLFAQFRQDHGTLPTGPIMAALASEPAWPGQVGEWTVGRCGVSEKPLRLASRQANGTHLIIGKGVSAEEFETLLGTLATIDGPGEEADRLGARHRKALADRWFNAPRTPYRLGIDPM